MARVSSRQVARRRQGPRGKKQWRRLIEEQAASPLTQEEFCSKRRISVHAFRHWKYRVLERDEHAKEKDSGARNLPAPTSGFVPVEVIFDTPTAPVIEDPPIHRSELELEASGVQVVLPGGLRIDVQAGFEPAVLRQVVEVLGC